MSDYAWNITRTVLVFMAVGACLALLAPHIAVSLGVFASVGEACYTMGLGANPVFQALFFGLFGGMSTAATPIMDSLRGNKAPETHQAETPQPTAQLGKSPTVAIAPPETTLPEAAPETQTPPTQFVQKRMEEKATHAALATYR